MRPAGGSRTSASPSARVARVAGRPPSCVETFKTASIASMAERLSGTPSGSISLLLPAGSDVTNAPDALRHTGPFAPASAAPVTQAYVTLGQGSPSYAVTAVSLAQPKADAPVNLTFTTSAQPLLHRLFGAEGAAAAIPALTISVRDGTGAGLLTYSLSGLSVTSFAENLSGQVTGTATLTGRPR